MLRNIFISLSLLALIYISYSAERATPVQKKSKGQFSAESASEYLEGIASTTHPIGSIENQKVRDYIVRILENEGLEVRIEKGYIRNSWKPTFVKMAYVENIIATLRGTDPNSKKVVIAAHYDSVFEGPGAADDGYAVASMIETVKLLKDQPRKNDIELLITDGEEMGLLGAQHYAKHNDLSNIGVFLNFEARGNAGPGLAFEYSDDNAWLITEMKKASKRPIANSLSYEIYKLMPNATDFTVFKRKGVQGINYAFIDGFSYYHNPVDNIENLSMESMQHTGENMYLMARHFANYEFGNQTSGNATFFNFYGNLIHYPANADLYVLIFIFLLLGYTIYRYAKDEQVTIKGILLSVFSLLGILILIAAVNFGLAALAKYFYPQYSTFYNYQYYNHEWYLLAGIGLTLCISWFLLSGLIRKLGHKNVAIAAAEILALLSLILYVYIPTGTYLMMYPLLALTVGLLIIDMLKVQETHWQSVVLTLGMLSVFVGFWTSFSHNLFLGFSFGALPGAVIPTALLTFAFAGLWPAVYARKEFLLPILGICLFSYSMIHAHLRSHPTKSEPLNSNLFYVTDLNTDQSYWATRDDYINAGHLGRLDDAQPARLPIHLPYSRWIKKSDQPALHLVSKIEADTTRRTSHSTLKVKNPKRAAVSYIVLNEIENVDKLLVNGELNKDFKEGATGVFYTTMYGIGLDSMDVTVIKRDTTKNVEAYLNLKYQEPFEKEELPTEIVRSDGFTLVSHRVEF